MPKILNGFQGQDPTAQAIAALGAALFGDKTSSELNREKLRATQRENVETENYANMVRDSGAAVAASTPLAQAMLFASGRKPGDAAELGLLDAATQYGATDPRTQNLQVGAGGAYSSTAKAFQDVQIQKALEAEATLAEQRRQFNMKPQEAIVEGRPAFVGQGEATRPGVAPILSDAETKGFYAGQNFGRMGALPSAEQNYLGADGANRTARNYVAPGGGRHITADGVTDVQTGQPLPPGGYLANVEGGADATGVTTSVRTGLQGNVIASQKFMSLINRALPLTQDPSLFGITAGVRSKAQDLAQAVIQQAGGPQAVDEARRELVTKLGGVAQTLVPELYDPRLSEVETLWGLLLYQGASAIAEQEGRSISDRDLTQWRSILGDPHSMFSSNIAMQTKLLSAQKTVQDFDRINRQALTGESPAPLPQIPNPGAPIVDDTVAVTTPQEAMQLPSGTRFRTPDGRVKVRP